MGIQWLYEDSLDFPDVHTALIDPPGLLAAGGDLSPARLLNAYQHGIFPWYEEFLENGEKSPILWWSPDPRSVLFTDNLRLTRSLKKRIRNGGFELACNQGFRETITACSEARAYSQGTWLNPAMIEAYCELHELGYAQSIECWKDGELVGGLYGLAIGKMFYGESMFSREKDASKIALTYLCCLLYEQETDLIDCQVANPHLESMGARDISLDEFLNRSQTLCAEEALQFPDEKIDAALIENYPLVNALNSKASP